MEYQEIIAILDERFAGAGHEYERSLLAKAKEFEAGGIVIPAKLRAWLRQQIERERTPVCDRLNKRGACSWLSRQQPVGETAGCPFYDRGEDPRNCERYRPSDERGRGVKPW